MQPIVIADRLSKVYETRGSEVEAVKDVSFSVMPGEIFGLFGPNGAGKSTIVRMLTTLLLPTGGSASVNGFDIVKEEIQVRASVGLVTADERSFYGRLTAEQNMAFYAAMQNVPRSQVSRRVHDVLDTFGLVSQATQSAQSLSTGQKQRLNMARALVHDPAVLFLDEPTKSMDVQTSDFVKRLIKEQLVGRQRKTIVYISHELYEMENFCDRVLILSKGRKQVVGTPEELAARLPRRDVFRIVIKGRTDPAVRSWQRLPGVESIEEISRGMALTSFDLTLAGEISSTWMSVLNAAAECGASVESYRRVDDESLRRIVDHFSREDQQL